MANVDATQFEVMLAAHADDIKAIKATHAADPPPEKKIHAAWAEHMDPEAPATSVTSTAYDNEIFTLGNLFSVAECDRLIQASEGKGNGYGKTNYAKKYRGNLRLISTDQTLAATLWRRMQPFVSAQVQRSGYVWEAIGLNECFRLSKYFPGDQFQRHVDANFQRGSNEQSMYTVNIYLNGDFGGGSTRFYKDNTTDVDFAVTPEAGKCVIFRQPPAEYYMHDGEALGSGLKYLLRTDIMYQRLGPIPTDETTLLAEEAGAQRQETIFKGAA
jgi:hypothetical protein